MLLSVQKSMGFTLDPCGRFYKNAAIKIIQFQDHTKAEVSKSILMWCS